jgi:hypothetical protein
MKKLWMLLGLCLAAAAQEADLPHTAPRKIFDARPIVPAATINEMLRGTPRGTIRDIRFAGTWRPNLDTGLPAVRFENCAFEGGVNFSGQLHDTEFIFDRCTFSKSLDEDGEDVHISGASFSRPLIFNQCVFPTAVRIVDSVFSAQFTARDCSFQRRIIVAESRFAGMADFSASRFDHDVSLENVRAFDRMSFAAAFFAASLVLENGHYSSGVDLTSLSFRGPTSRSRVILKGPGIRGELVVERSFRPRIAPPRSLEIHPSSRLESILGLTWADFEHAFSGSTPREFLAVLPVLRQSLQSEGMHEDAARAFVESKRYKAQEGSWVDRTVDWFMRKSSGWGTQGMGLVVWFCTTWMLFAIVYAFLLAEFVTGVSGTRKVARCLGQFLSAAVLSLKITFLQGGDEQFQWAAGETSPAKHIRARAHYIILVHSVVATVLLLMLGGYLGAQFSGI